MESIKETELNLQREVVTTVPNTWLVEAVNPSTGEKKMIDIANYASVVAGQMSTSKLFPFMNLGAVPSGDLNNLKTSGIYYLSDNSNYTNGPGFGWCAFIVFKSLHTVQVAIATGEGTTKYYSRIFDSNSTWSSWQRIDNFGYNTLAELASAMRSSLKLQNFGSAAISSTNTALKDIVEQDIIATYPNIVGFVCGIISNASGTHNYWGHLYKSGSYYYGTINIQLLGEKTIHTLTLSKSVATE